MNTMRINPIKTLGISPKLYGAIIGATLVWLVQAVFGIDANTVHLIDIAGDEVNLGDVLNLIGAAAGAYLAPTGEVCVGTPEDPETPGDVDPAAGNPAIPPSVA